METNERCPHAREVRLMVFDIDGVFTDGSIDYSSNGLTTRRFSVYDGLGVELLLKAGLKVAIVTAKHPGEGVKERFLSLGVEQFLTNQADKLKALTLLMRDGKITKPKEVGFMGDDLIDLEAMLFCGFSAAPFNAVSEVKQNARWISTSLGGNGAVREVCQTILRSQDLYEKVTRSYYSPLTSLQEQCYEALQNHVPPGCVITYGALAKLIGRPGAARAVGEAMRKNPFMPGVPCHRVVLADGKLGGFRLGSEVKASRLKAEGLKIKNGSIVNFSKVSIGSDS